MKLEQIIAEFTAQVCKDRDARWERALDAAMAANELEHKESDIKHIAARIAAEANRDIQADLIMTLYESAWPLVRRQLLMGIDTWYKAMLKPLPKEGALDAIQDA